MTDRQRKVLRLVWAHGQTSATAWYRAAHPGQRVTLASLYRAGVLTRRARRGNAGEADAAYEYRVVFLDMLALD